MRILRFRPSFARPWQSSQGHAVALLALLAGGCSADITRFDGPGFSLNDSGGGTTSSIPTPPESVRGGGAGYSELGYSGRPAEAGGSYPRPHSQDQAVHVSTLPDASQPVAPRYSPSYAPSSAPTAESVPAGPGDAIEVQQGDTLYGLSRRYGVSVPELMAANDLRSPDLKLGQRLYLPSGHSAQRALSHATTPPSISAPPSTAASSPVGWDGTYTVRPGDSLFGIARQHNVRVAELQQANAISDPRRVHPGAVLKVPGSGASAATAPSYEAPAAAQQRVIVDSTPRSAVRSTTQPTIINGGGQRLASLSDRLSDAQGAAPPGPTVPPIQPSGEAAAKSPQVATLAPVEQPSSGAKLRWPVNGRIVAGFGPRTDGTHNDGINLSVPIGTEVHAAESGVVAYAGSELKGFGKLVLVRHDNGWVTAYAHNDELLVKYNDRIERGQVIAKAGKSGQVDQPQLHFELRQDSKPVDPTPFMEKL